ncbi:MAG: DUF2911 domain-containing protein, partial [Verrucomicrobiota bacterium]
PMSLLVPRLLLTAALIGSVLSLPAQPAAPAATKPNSTGGNSPHETISAKIGNPRNGPMVTITYGRPYAKGRVIWGTLVPWDQAWRVGSDEATTLIAQQALVIGEATIPAGVAYTLYMVPSEKGVSKLAFSTAIGKWGIPVDTTHDLVRVDMKKGTVEKPVEQLTITVENDAATGGGTLKVTWDTTQFSVPFTLKK